MKWLPTIWAILLLLLVGCDGSQTSMRDKRPENASPSTPQPEGPYIVVLGTAQDAGYPQAGCIKKCCAPAWKNPSLSHSPACIALVNPASKEKWLFEATPDFPRQLNRLNGLLDSGDGQLPDGIFITHAHMGHYSGLLHLGREVQGSERLPVHVMPKMARFLRENGPWSQLVDLENIDLREMKADSVFSLGNALEVKPILVPHRDEFSETVGFRISHGGKAALFIPDINKWELWDRSLEAELAAVDIAFLDGTFFQENELPGRNMAEIPHPFMVETMELLANIPLEERKKVKFIHFNHSNPMHFDENARLQVREKGFDLAEEGMVFDLY